jgi:hypothetical protein
VGREGGWGRRKAEPREREEERRSRAVVRIVCVDGWMPVFFWVGWSVGCVISEGSGDLFALLAL